MTRIKPLDPATKKKVWADPDANAGAGWGDMRRAGHDPREDDEGGEMPDLGLLDDLDKEPRK